MAELNKMIHNETTEVAGKAKISELVQMTEVTVITEVAQVNEMTQES